MALKFTVHGVQSFIKGHRKSGVISIKHSVMTNRIGPLTVVRFLHVSATYNIGTGDGCVGKGSHGLLTF